MSNYVAMAPIPGANNCFLEDLENFDDPPALRGSRKIEQWPADVRFHMDPNFPKAIKLVDCIGNMASAFVASKRLKEAIEAAGPASVQYLPVSIINHKGRLASDEYFVINPFKLQDCIDQKASSLTWNSIDPTLISGCGSLVLDESRIASKATLFRLKHYPFRLIFRRDLADEIKRQKFSGLTFIEIADIE